MRVLKSPHHYKVTALGSCVKWPWGADHTSHFWHRSSALLAGTVWKVVGQHLIFSIFPNNFTVGTKSLVWLGAWEVGEVSTWHPTTICLFAWHPIRQYRRCGHARSQETWYCTEEKADECSISWRRVAQLPPADLIKWPNLNTWTQKVGLFFDTAGNQNWHFSCPDHLRNRSSPTWRSIIRRNSQITC